MFNFLPRRVARRLLRAPMFTVVAVLTLALGIAANTAIFSVVRGVLLKPLPFDEPASLVGVWHTAPGLNIDPLNMSPATYLVYREEGRVFEDVGLWDNGAVSVTGTGEPERVQTLTVTDGTLPLLHVRPALGRLVTAEDDSPKTPERVILSHAYWLRKFGGDQAVVGKSVVVDNRPREIIGVLPDGFRFLDLSPQLVLPFRFNRSELHVANFSYQGVARLKPGFTIEQANADVARLIPVLPDRFPMPRGFTRKMFDDVRIGPKVRPFSVDAVGDIGRVLWILLGTVGFVLLIACANVANLFLVRAEARQQELAIHAALGAGSRRIAWELLSESLTLALLGGTAGLVLAAAGIRILVANAPDGLPRVHDIGIDPLVLLFTLGISVLAGLLFGAIPVLKFARPNLASALKEGGRLSSTGRERHRARNTLVVAEIGLAVVLLVASGLMIRSFFALGRVEPGFVRSEEVLTLRVSIPSTLIPNDEQALRTHEQIVRRIEQIPGVVSVGVSSSITMDGNDSNDPIFVEDFPSQVEKLPPLRRFKWIAQNDFYDSKAFAQRNLGYAIRSERTGSPTLLKEIQQSVWSVNGNLPIAGVRTLDLIRARSMAQTSFALVMLGIAAAVALLLGVVGIYGVIAYVATQRTKEIGIRIALGAASRDVSGLFVRHGMVLAAAGIGCGLAAAALLTRAMSALLFGVNAIDPLTYAAVSIALGATAVLASYLPARRATRIDPAEALRWEA
jgi:predicted permease